MEWFIDRAKSWGAETCLFLGDYFHNRHQIAVASLDQALKGLELISNAGFQKTIFLKGNHDIAMKETRKISSLNFADHIDNIVIIHNPIEIDNVAFVPWLTKGEHEAIAHLKARYAFGHLETIGGMMNAHIMCTGGDHAIEPNHFQHQECAFSGHFHRRQIITGKHSEIIYMGNICPFDFSDQDDDQRGIMLLEWGQDPLFESWPQQPLYRSIRLSELLTTADTVLKPNMTVRISVDMPLEYDEAQEMRDGLINLYGLRKVELNHNRDDVAQDVITSVALQTVDEIVVGGLQNIESVGLSNRRLIEIYQSLI